MDLEMPDADSWEVVRRLKTDARTSRIPIIGVSAYALDSERETAIATGCDEFNVKPIEFESLVASIRRVVPKPITYPLRRSGRRAARQAHSEHRALARLARHGDVATHHLTELSADHEPKARAAILARSLG